VSAPEFVLCERHGPCPECGTRVERMWYLIVSACVLRAVACEACAEPKEER